MLATPMQTVHIMQALLRKNRAQRLVPGRQPQRLLQSGPGTPARYCWLGRQATLLLRMTRSGLPVNGQ